MITSSLPLVSGSLVGAPSLTNATLYCRRNSSHALRTYAVPRASPPHSCTDSTTMPWKSATAPSPYTRRTHWNIAAAAALIMSCLLVVVFVRLVERQFARERAIGVDD